MNACLAKLAAAALLAVSSVSQAQIPTVGPSTPMVTVDQERLLRMELTQLQLQLLAILQEQGMQSGGRSATDKCAAPTSVSVSLFTEKGDAP
jgi:hypothetical protein